MPLFPPKRKSDKCYIILTVIGTTKTTRIIMSLDFKQGVHARFTVHMKGDNPPVEDLMKEIISNVMQVCKLEHNIIACVIGREQGGETKRWHGQGYMRFNKKVKLTVLRKQINDILAPDIEIHYLKCDATPRGNWNYCTKDGIYEEYGEFPDKGQGRREDIMMVHKQVLETAGTPDAELQLFRDHPIAMYKYFKGAERFAALVAKEKRAESGYVQPTVKVFWGSTRKGKSRKAAWEAAQEGGPVYYKGSGKFWCGYDHEKNIIWEEFDGSWLTPTECLRTLDGFPINVETKGGHRIIPAGAHIWITSNTNPNHWWPGARANKPLWDGWAALRARFSVVLHFQGEWKPPIVEIVSAVPSTSKTLGQKRTRALKINIPPRKKLRFNDTIDISSDDEVIDTGYNTEEYTSENQEGESWFDL